MSDDAVLRAEITRLATALRALIALPEWKTFEHCAEQWLDDAKARVVSGSEEDFNYHKGVFWGGRDLLRLPHTIIEMANRLETT